MSFSCGGFTGCEVVNYMKEGMIEDWDTFEKVLDYSYDKCIKSEAQYHPVLFSEATVCTVIFCIYLLTFFYLIFTYNCNRLSKFLRHLINYRSRI